MNRILFIILLTNIGYGSAKAQLNPIHTQFYNYDYVINPSLSGKGFKNDQNAIIGSFRDQWTGFSGGNPRTIAFGSDFNLNKIGLGLRLVQDDQGAAFSYTGLDFSISPHVFKFNSNNVFRLGMGATFRQNQFNIDELVNIETNDPLLNSSQSTSYYNFSFGASYGFNKKSNSFLIAFSLNDLMQKESNSEALLFLKFKKDQKFELINLLRIRDVLPTQNDLIVRLSLKSSPFKVGAFYRQSLNRVSPDAAGFILNFIINKKIDIGYSSDFSTSGMQSQSAGTHELSMAIPIQSDFNFNQKTKNSNSDKCQIDDITIIDPADRTSESTQAGNGAVEVNLLDNELINYDFNGFEFIIDNKLNEKNITYDVVWKDGFTENSNTVIDKISGPNKLIKIEDIAEDYDKIIVEIYKYCKSTKSELFTVSFIPR